MSKDLEQLRLNTIRNLMEMDYDSLLLVKEFIESTSNRGWNEHINDKTVEFVDFSKLSKMKSKTDDKLKIVFL